MGKSFAHIKAMAQPDQTACWSTSMAWWTRAVCRVKDYSELDILGMFSHLAGSDGGLKFTDGYKRMLSDPLWGMTVEDVSMGVQMRDLANTVFKASPVMCGYWETAVGGYHSVALYNYKVFDGVWAMDPNGGVHVFRSFDYYFTPHRPTVFGYIAPPQLKK